MHPRATTPFITVRPLSPSRHRPSSCKTTPNPQKWHSLLCFWLEAAVSFAQHGHSTRRPHARHRFPVQARHPCGHPTSCRYAPSLYTFVEDLSTRSKCETPALENNVADTACFRRRVLLDTPARTTLFNNIASFVHGKLASLDGQEEPASKRRRVDIAQPSAQSETRPQQNGHGDGSQSGLLSANAAAADPVLLEVKEISVTAPQRKKYDLCFTKHFLYARASGTSVPAQGLVYPWKDFGSFLPVPSPMPEIVQLVD